MLLPGFYWVKQQTNGRWEVAEFDGVTWNIGPEIYLIGPRIPEPAH